MRALNLLRCTVVLLPVGLVRLANATTLRPTSIASQVTQAFFVGNPGARINQIPDLESGLPLSDAQAPQSSGTGNTAECPSESCPFPNNIVSYDNFIQFVGEEDSLLRGEPLTGRQQITSRTDYSSAIGISRVQEQEVLTIVVDTYRRRLENRKQFEQANIENVIARQRGQEASPVSFRDNARADGVLLYQTWTKLQEALGAGDFKKLDIYVSHEFARPRSPGQDSSQQEENKPFPLNVTYLFFISHVATEDARVKREIQEGKPGFRQNYSLAAHFPEGKELPLRNIVLEAYARLMDNDDRISHFPDERRKYGWAQATKMPAPPGLVALAQERDTIIDETRDKLKQELGEESFNNLDEWIKKRFGAGKIIGGTASPSIPTTH